jgi:small subunit ribosomal protein S16
MLKIRLQRAGKRRQAYFRVVLVEHTKKPIGKFLELLGNYDPHKKEFKVKMERVNFWISKGAQVSPTVNNLLVNHKYWDKPKLTSWKPKKGNEQKNNLQKENQKEEDLKTKTSEKEVNGSASESFTQQ